MSFDCAKEMYRDEYVAYYYYTDGTNDRSESKDWGGMKWSAVPPDTVVKGHFRISSARGNQNER